MKRALTQAEELMLLKSIFYEFGLREVKTLLGENDYNIGNFIFKDKHQPDRVPSTVLGSLINADVEYFDENKRSERVITHVKISIERIEKKQENSENTVYLQDITFLSLVETKAYYELLKNIMSAKNPDGYLINPARDSAPKRLYYEYDHKPPFPPYIGR